MWCFIPGRHLAASPPPCRRFNLPASGSRHIILTYKRDLEPMPHQQQSVPPPRSSPARFRFPVPRPRIRDGQRDNETARAMMIPPSSLDLRTSLADILTCIVLLFRMTCHGRLDRHIISTTSNYLVYPHPAGVARLCTHWDVCPYIPPGGRYLTARLDSPAPDLRPLLRNPSCSDMEQAGMVIRHWRQ